MNRLIIVLTLICVSCATTVPPVINSGSYEKDGKNSFVIQVDPGVKASDYTFLRVAYELCKPTSNGITIMTKSLMQPPGGTPWIEGKIACEGPIDKSLDNLYSKAIDKFVVKKELEGYSYKLVTPTKKEN